MSGFEVVGAVLGVLPLLISAAEHYEDVFKPFKRFKKCAPELELYQQQLKTQKMIFLNQCQLLLTALTGRESAKEMLREKDHPSWNDNVLKKKLVEQLGNSREACETTVQMIAGKLRSIEEDAESFGTILQESIPLRSIGDKAWRSRIQKRLEFSFSESRLNEYLNDLRQLNQDFRTLAKQTSRLDRQKYSDSSPQVAAVYSSKKIEESRLVQRASAQLYDAMGRACQHHTEHYAHFQLLPQNVGSTDTDSPFVHFNIAFTHDVSGTSATLKPVWIAVDSSFAENTSNESNKTILQPDASSSLSRTLAHNLDSEALQPRKKIKTQKSVRFVKLAPTCSSSGPTRAMGCQESSSSNNCLTGTQSQPNDPSSTSWTTTTSYQHSSLPDFCVKHDFCHQLRKSCTYSRSPGNKYIGYFQKAGPCKHLVYFAAPISMGNYTHPKSLVSIIKTTAQKPEIEQFMEYERLRLAARLASAVLQFHATPLLQGFWRSEDVIFFGHSKDDDVACITSPHLSVQVSSTKAHKLVTQAGSNADNLTGHLIRNPYLFSLGVTLIELAFQAPLRSLYNSEDLVNEQLNTLSDFFVASRLSKTISSSLGPVYGKVVRKCLGCDFGQGTNDLNDVKLQAVFYRDVICELERLERAFAMLQLGE